MQNDPTSDGDTSGVAITQALPDDAEAIVALRTPNVSKQSVLPRPVSDIRNAIDTFRVARTPAGRVVGCVALKQWDAGLHEIRSLVVHDDFAGQGLGSRLLDTIIDYARTLHAHELFTLTIRPNLFRRLGFAIVPKQRYSQKIWSDCLQCDKHHANTCDETALALLL